MPSLQYCNTFKMKVHKKKLGISLDYYWVYIFCLVYQNISDLYVFCNLNSNFILKLNSNIIISSLLYYTS